MYVVAFYVITLSLRMVSSEVLVRLFSPEYFGLMALLTTVLVGLNLFSHIGLADSVIQHPRGDEPIFLNTGWTLQVLRVAGLWAVTIILAWPVAHFYHEPRMTTLLPALGLGCLIAGASSPSLPNLPRHIGAGKVTFLEIPGQIVQFVVTLMCVDSTVAVGTGRRPNRAENGPNGGQLFRHSRTSTALRPG